MLDRQARVVDAEQVQHGGVEVVVGGDVGHGPPRPRVALTVRRPPLDAGTRHPADKRAAVVVASLAPLRERHPSELRVPQHERVLQQAALLEVAQQARDRLVGRQAHRRQLFQDAVVVVPIVGRTARSAPDLDEPHAPFDQPPGQQTALAEVLGRLFIQAVLLVSRRRFPAEIERFGGAQLHLRRQLVRPDAGLQPAVVIVRGEMRPVELLQQRQSVAVGCGGDELRRSGGLQIGDRFGERRVDDRPLVRHRQEARREVSLLVVRQAARVGEHDKRRQVVG